jgi:hypothetical protein
MAEAPSNELHSIFSWMSPLESCPWAAVPELESQPLLYALV